jgi:hypothetical protein
MATKKFVYGTRTRLMANFEAQQDILITDEVLVFMPNYVNKQCIVKDAATISGQNIKKCIYVASSNEDILDVSLRSKPPESV